jgi:hypothetical protein
MAVRIYPEGYEYMDAVGPSSTAGSGLIIDDGFTTPPWVDRPDQQRNDLFLNQTLRRLMTTPREVLAATRPPLPPIPPTFGYNVNQLTLDDVVDGSFSARRRDPGANLEGSLRNSQSAVNPIG